MEANIGISRTLIDNSDLEFSLIGRMECTQAGETNSEIVDSDFLIGLDTDSYGYTKDNCENLAKEELLERLLLIRYVIISFS